MTLAEGISEEAWSSASFNGCESLKYVNIPSNWTRIPGQFLCGVTGPLEISIPYGITEIGSFAFQNCTGMKSVTIPSSVTKIGAYAFYNCGFTSLTIPDSVTELGSFAIAACANLQEIKFPSAWTELPSGIFQNNTSLKSYTIPEGIVTIGTSAFENSAIEEIVFADTVTKIGDAAFRDCGSLKSLTIPAQVHTIGASAFEGCTGLTSVAIPGTIQELKEFVFSDCDGLTTVTIEDGVKKIDGFAFAYCDKLTEAVIPDSVDGIASEAFYGSNPGRIHITASADSWAAKYAAVVLYIYSDYSPAIEEATFAFSDKKLATQSTISRPTYNMNYGALVYQISSADEVVRPNNMISNYDWYYNYTLNFSAVINGTSESFRQADLVVGDFVAQTAVPVTGVIDSAFINCTSLKNITLGANIRTLGSAIFSGCTGLVSVDLSRTKATSIGSRAFKDCTGLKSVIWPSELTMIDSSAFAGCSSLGSVSFRGTKIKTIGDYAFQGSNLTSVELIEGLETIGEYAFRENLLTDAYLPSSLKNLQPTSFDPEVTLHFTGDATSVNYKWVDLFGQVHYDPVLALLLELNTIRIEQFFGEGLERQRTYFISTETAGLHVPNRTLTRTAEEEATGAVNTVSAAVSADGEAAVLPIAEPASTPPEVGMPAPSGGNSEESEDGEETALRLFEVVSSIVEENPFITVLLTLLFAAIVVMGGVRRYRKVR